MEIIYKRALRPQPAREVKAGLYYEEFLEVSGYACHACCRHIVLSLMLRPPRESSTLQRPSAWPRARQGTIMQHLRQLAVGDRSLLDCNGVQFCLLHICRLCGRYRRRRKQVIAMSLRWCCASALQTWSVLPVPCKLHDGVSKRTAERGNPNRTRIASRMPEELKPQWRAFQTDKDGAQQVSGSGQLDADPIGRLRCQGARLLC